MTNDSNLQFQRAFLESNFETITISVPGVPVAQPRQRVAMIGGFIRNYTPTAAPVNAFKAAVQIAWSNASNAQPAKGPLRLSVAFVLPRPKKLNGKKYSGNREWFNRKPDIDNCLKSLKDALNHFAWEDDRQVCEVYATKQYASVDESPHTIVQVGPCHGYLLS